MLRFLVLLLCIQRGYGYSGGAPGSACDSMMPEHGVLSQQCQANYLIQAEKTEFNGNDVIRITVRGATSADHFKGFLLTAKNDRDQRIMGTWSVANASLATVACNDIANTAVTHSSADDKSQIEALWHAPSNISDDNTIIRATIVKTHSEIFVNCFQLTLKSKQVNPQANQPVVQSGTITAPSRTNTNVTWSYSNNTVTVTMITREANMNEWRSIGFSLDEEMGDEYVFVCQVSVTRNVLLQRMHTKPGRQRPLSTNQSVTVIRTAYENGFATCQFSFETNAVQSDGEPAPIVIDKNYHILFASGILKTGGQIAKHNQTSATSKTYQLQSSATVDFDALDVTTPASTALNNSSTQRDAGAVISWTYTNGITDVTMVISDLGASRWFALGLSIDQMMGEDHVFSCEHLSDNTVSLRRLVNPGGYKSPVPVNTGVQFNITQQKFENGQITCAFTLSNFAEMKRHPRQINVPVLSQTTMYYPLIAMGNLVGSNAMAKHASNGRRALAQQVSLSREERINYNGASAGADLTGLMKAHGIIMIFAWLVLVSTGILVARYFKLSWPKRKICGKAVWFAIHRALMMSAVLLTLIAFVLILIYKKGQWTSRMNQREFAHSIVGILVIGLATAQPFMALFRCNPDARYRFIFNYAHATVGLCAFTLSIAAIFLAMFFSQFEFELKKEWGILVAWSCWLPVIFILFEIIELCRRKSVLEVEEVNSYDMGADNPYFHPRREAKPNPVQVTQNSRLGRVKGFLLLFHLIVAVGLSVALMVLIGQS